jgi:hypothetical protein
MACTHLIWHHSQELIAVRSVLEYCDGTCFQWTKRLLKQPVHLSNSSFIVSLYPPIPLPPCRAPCSHNETQRPTFRLASMSNSLPLPSIAFSPGQGISFNSPFPRPTSRIASPTSPTDSGPKGLLVPTDRTLEDLVENWLPGLGRLKVEKEVTLHGYALYALRTWYV